MPTYGDDNTRGFYLRDGGYYWAINDYMDLKLTGEIYTKGQYMALLIKEIKITSKNMSVESAGTNSLQDILISCEKFPPFIYEEFFEKYSKVFDKYIPKFYKNVQCPNCSTSFKYNTDLETEFFRRSLSGREKI